MAEKDLFFGQGVEAEDSRGIFSKLSSLIMNNEITVGSDVGPSDPDGGSFAKLAPPANPLEGTGVELLPPVSESQIAWAGGVGTGSQIRLELVASDKR